MKVYLYLSLSIFCTLVHLNGSSSSLSPCGNSFPNWVAYEDEKCFLIVNQFVTFEEAKQVCAQQDIGDSPISLLPTIGSLDEEEFLKKFIFQDNAIVENVWLGGVRKNGENEFIWEDGTPLDFTNWGVGSPSTDPEKNCSQMTSHLSRKDGQKIEVGNDLDGLWSDVSCLKRNLVVCQKLQSWSPAEFQKLFLEMRKEMADLKANPVPIGFVYVQLPDQSEPMVTWPTLKWKDITAEYAGLFFRAGGGAAADFGVEQAENSPKILKVEHEAHAFNNDFVQQIDINYGGWSRYVSVDKNTIGTWLEELRFYSIGGEVRPRNKAVRIWTRVD